MRWSTRVLLSSLAAVLAPLSLLALVGVPAIAERFSRSAEASRERTARAVSALLTDRLEDLEREARLLARDATVLHGVTTGDWGTPARGASARLSSLTLDGVADVVIVAGPDGAALVRVPASADPAAFPRTVEPGASVRLVAGAPVLLAKAPVLGDGREAGTVLLGRRLDTVTARLAPDAPRVELAFLTGDTPRYATFPEAAGLSWAEAGSGRLEAGALSYRTRLLGRWGEDTLWLVTPDGDAGAARRALWAWVAALLLVAGSATFALTWLLTRRVLGPLEALGAGARRMAGGDFGARVPVPGGGAELEEVVRAFNDLGAALERRQQEVSRRGREIEALSAVALAVNRAVDLVSTAEETLEAVRRVAGMDVAALYQVDPGRETLSLVAQRGLPEEILAEIGIRPIEGSLLGRAVREGRPTVSRGIAAGVDGVLGALAAARGHKTQLALPIPVAGETWGVMALVSSERREFDAEEMRLLEAVASQIGVAVERASLFAETREKGRRLETLVGLAQTLTASLDHGAVLGEVARAASGLIADSFVRLWVAEEDRLVAVAQAPGAAPPADSPATLALGEGLAGHVAQSRDPLVVEQVLADPRAVNVDWVRREGFVSFCGIPLLFQGRLLGVLAILTRRRHAFTKEEMELLLSFATQAAIAMENARLYAEAARSAAEHQALLEVGSLVSSTLKVERVLDVIVERARALLGVRAAGLFRLEEDSGTLVYERGIGLSPEFIRALRVRPGEGTSGKALRYRAPAWTADLLHDPDLVLGDETRALVEREGYRAVLSVPILIKNRPYGVLAVYWWERRSPTFSEVRLLSALGGQAAVALENAQLFAREQRRRAQVEALVDIERELAAELNPDRLLDLIIQRAGGLLASRGVVFLLDEDARLLVPRASYDMPPQIRDIRLPLGVGIEGVAAAERRGLLANDFVATPYAAALVQHGVPLLGTGHAMAQPLVSRDRLLGVVTLSRPEEAPRYTQEDLETFEGFAAQAAIALENARLYREAREHGERLKALDEVNRLVSSSLEVEEVLQNIARAASSFFDAPHAHVWVAVEGGRRLRRSVVIGDPEFAAGLAEDMEVGEGGVGWVARSREPMLWTDLEQDGRVLRRAWALRHGLRYFTAYPIALGDRLLGAITMYRTAPSPVTPETEGLLRSLVAQAAVALDNARLYAETSRRLAETQALLEVSEILGSTLDVRRLLSQVAMKTAQVCRVDRCTIRVWQGEQTVPLMSQFADGRKARDLWSRFVSTPLALRDVPAYRLAIETRKPVVVPEASLKDLFPPDWVEGFGMRGSLVVPLIRQDRVVGVMNLEYTDRAGAYEQWQLDLATTIAGQVALALENSRLYDEARERLKETQTLLAVGQVLSRNLPTQEAMRQVAREVAHAFGADMVGAYFLDARRETLVPLAGYHVPKHLLGTFLETPFPVARLGLVGEAWETRRPAWTSAGLTDPRWFGAALPGGVPDHSVLFAPTLVRGEVTGGLFLVWWRPGRAFTPVELRLVEGVAAQVGLALENADLARQTQEKLREAETLLGVSRTLSSTLDLYPLLRHFLRAVARTIESDSVGVWLASPATGLLEPAVGYRVPPALLKTLRRVRIDPQESEFYREAFRSRRVQVSSDVPGDPRIPEAFKRAAPHRVQLIAPIVAKDRVIGAFIAVWWERTREFSERELALIEGMASQAGVAVENARLFEENRRKVEELSVLHELSRAVTGQLDVGELVRAVRRQVARILDARNMAILLHDEATGETTVALRMLEGEEHPDPRRHPAGRGLVVRVLERRHAIRTDNYAEACRREGVEPLEESLRYPHWLGVPMIAGDRILGALVLRSDVAGFTAADERLLADIASLAALALRSARLFDERARAYEELAAAQDQLVRTEKLRALGEMASGVAHDFNNLLASILGRTQLLLRRVEDPKLQQWLRVVERAAMDGARTVQRIQEFARIRRDQPFEPVDLNRTIQEALEVTQSRWQEEAQSRGIAIEVATDPVPVPPVLGDPVELREALTNLILNAVDAMPEGGRLALATRVDRDRVVVTVSDTGVGMAPEVQARVFDPFFTTKGTRGTGLGLSITYGIVSRHRGQIDVESAEGRGTTFRLLFPVSTSEPERPAPAALPPASPLRCLVVDDEPPVLEVLGDLLATGGHSAVLMTDGARAIARFRAEPFDVVLTDLAMPGVNGWQVARAVKDHAPGVPVLMVTGWGVELSPSELRACGVDAVLPKPVKLEDVLNAVAAAAARRGD